VISERLEHVRSAAVGYWIAAGSRDEQATEAGVTHFIEHLLFKGTDRYSALQIAEIFDGLGGELNAATSREHTLVYARVPDHQLETAMDVMGEMVFSPAFAELDAERDVVLEGSQCTTMRRRKLVHDLIARPSSATTARPPGDRHADFVDPRRRSRYHAEMYVPGNIVVAAAGTTRRDRRLVEDAGQARRSQRRQAEPAARADRAPPPRLRFQRKDTRGTTCVLRRPASRALTAAVRGVAPRCDPGRLRVVRLFRRFARSAAWRTRSTRSSRNTPTPGRSASTGTREDSLGDALAITADDRRHRGRQPAAASRARETSRGASCSR
jgi:hypothetical protein